VENKKRFFWLIVIAILVSISVMGFTGCATRIPPVNTSLEGIWSRGDLVVTITGNNAIITQFNSNYRHREAVNIGMINVGDQHIRNIRQVDDLSWIGEFLMIRFEANSSGIITRYIGTGWSDGSITMSSNGETIQVTLDGLSQMTYHRVQ